MVRCDIQQHLGSGSLESVALAVCWHCNGSQEQEIKEGEEGEKAPWLIMIDVISQEIHFHQNIRLQRISQLAEKHSHLTLAKLSIHLPRQAPPASWPAGYPQYGANAGGFLYGPQQQQQ